MVGHILDVTARTTLPHAEARARGLGWTDEGVAVVDVRGGTTDDGRASGADDGLDSTGLVQLAVEVDPTDLVHVDPHADSVLLTPAQARALAAALESAAADVEGAAGDTGDPAGDVGDPAGDAGDPAGTTGDPAGGEGTSDTSNGRADRTDRSDTADRPEDI